MSADYFQIQREARRFHMEYELLIWVNLCDVSMSFLDHTMQGSLRLLNWRPNDLQCQFGHAIFRMCSLQR